MNHPYSLYDPLITTIMVFASMGIAFTILYVFYNSLKSKSVRETHIYLSGEPEEVVKEVSPSIGHLYWGFIRKFAKNTYSIILNRIQTGSLQDWFDFISSWLGLLFLLAILMIILYVTGVQV